MQELAELANLNVTLVELDAELADMDVTLIELDAGLADLDVTLIELDPGLADLDVTLIELDHGLELFQLFLCDSFQPSNDWMSHGNDNYHPYGKVSSDPTHADETCSINEAENEHVKHLDLVCLVFIDF